jgi:hypothetical protein
MLEVVAGQQGLELVVLDKLVVAMVLLEKAVLEQPHLQIPALVVVALVLMAHQQEELEALELSSSVMQTHIPMPHPLLVHLHLRILVDTKFTNGRAVARSHSKDDQCLISVDCGHQDNNCKQLGLVFGSQDPAPLRLAQQLVEILLRL